jgi:UDP-GlcNAc:undecaprenyl-phosphate/decaprenyl-phosphate GlcNAc-1-phosphate transferase
MKPPTAFFPVYIFANVLVGLVLALAVGLLAISMSRRLGLMDVPGALPHKRHTAPTPLAGGLTLVFSLAIGLVLVDFRQLASLWTVLLPALVVFGVGLWDDFRRLPATVKLLGQVLAAILLIAMGTYVRVIKPEATGLPQQAALLINWAITIFWMVGVTNAFNLVDSMDGLVVGLGGVAIAFLVLVTIGSQQGDLQNLLALLLGICGGLYFYNVSPARFFLGDSGAQTIGFLLAAVGILYNPSIFPQGSSWFLPILILGVPIFDTTLVVISRIRQGQPVFRASQDHTYHRLIGKGLDGARAVAVMHIAAVALGCLGFIALNLSPLYANLLFFAACLAGLGVLIWLQRTSA